MHRQTADQTVDRSVGLVYAVTGYFCHIHANVNSWEPASLEELQFTFFPLSPGSPNWQKPVNETTLPCLEKNFINFYFGFGFANLFCFHLIMTFYVSVW
jgi:hypothetical protein